MKRLVDVEDIEKFIHEHRCVIGFDKFLLVAGNDGRWHEALPLVKTAYDVDKVVEQLKKIKDTPQDDSVAEVASTRVWNKALQQSIQIVKSGVDTENNNGKEAYLTALEDYHRLISEECKLMSVQLNPYALHLKEYNDKVLERLKAGGNIELSEHSES